MLSVAFSFKTHLLSFLHFLFGVKNENRGYKWVSLSASLLSTLQVSDISVQFFFSASFLHLFNGELDGSFHWTRSWMPLNSAHSNQYVNAGINGAVQGLKNTHLNFTMDGLSWPMSDSEARKSDPDVKICILRPNCAEIHYTCLTIFGDRYLNLYCRQHQPYLNYHMDIIDGSLHYIIIIIYLLYSFTVLQ